MKRLLVSIFIVTDFLAYGQDLSTSFVVKHIDSIVLAITQQKNILLRECDSIADTNGNKVYKCWNYNFRDASKTDVSKVSISFNGLPEELCFYYENNKVIKRDVYRIRKAHSKLVWSIYFNNDKVIDYKGSSPEKGIDDDKIEQAYYFLSLAKEYATNVVHR